MKHIPDGAAKTLHGFIGQAVEPGAHIITDGWLGDENPPANCETASQFDPPKYSNRGKTPGIFALLVG